MRLSVMLVVAFLCFPLTANPNPLPQESHVYVEGYHSITAEPDLLELSVGISYVDLDVVAAKADVDRRSRDLISACKSAGIATQEIASADLQVTPMYEWRQGYRHFFGTRVSRQISISLEGISKTPEQDTHASELEESEEVVGVTLVTRDEPAKVVEPGKQPLDLPAPLVAT